VAPAIGGIGEAMLDGLTGVLVRERTASALAAAVLDVLGDARLRERAAVEGPAMVAKKFGQERMMREMLAIYRDGAVKA
jgi:glycosyltransferase involved in cell wall biosynthesis